MMHPRAFLDSWRRSIERANNSDNSTAEIAYLLRAIRNVLSQEKNEIQESQKAPYIEALQALLPCASKKQKKTIENLLLFRERTPIEEAHELTEALRAPRDIEKIVETCIDEFSLENLTATELQREVRDLARKLISEKKIFTSSTSKESDIDEIIKANFSNEGTCAGEAIAACLRGGKAKEKQHVMDALALQLLEHIRMQIENSEGELSGSLTSDYLNNIYRHYFTGYAGKMHDTHEISNLIILKNRLQNTSTCRMLLCLQPRLAHESGHLVSIFKEDGSFYLFDCLDANSDRVFRTIRFEAILRRLNYNWAWYYCLCTEGGTLSYKILEKE
jgi:hypothetical protein